MNNDESIRFRLPAELKTEAQKFCLTNDLYVGEWLRELMRENLGYRPTRLRPRKRPAKPLKLSDGTTLNR